MSHLPSNKLCPSVMKQMLESSGIKAKQVVPNPIVVLNNRREKHTPADELKELLHLGERPSGGGAMPCVAEGAPVIQKLW